MDDQIKNGSLVLITFDDLLMKFAKNNDLGEYEIIVASHEIAGSLTLRQSIAGMPTASQYESKYDNIEFVPSLRPCVSAMEHAFGQSKESYIEIYNSQLLDVEPLTDLCCIIDMIVNQGIDCLLVVSQYEQAARMFDYLGAFIKDMFLLESYQFTDLDNLVETYGTPLYEKTRVSVPFDVPDKFDGIHLDCIVKNIGDVSAIKEKLELEKTIAASMQARPGEEESFKDLFFNRFTETLEDKVREQLQKRTMDDIKDICRDRGLRISPSATKEMLIDNIIHSIKLYTAKCVDYEEVTE